MITEKDLQEAIAECEGQRDPNANTCIKLAAFYTIRNELFPPVVPEVEEYKQLQNTNGYSHGPESPEQANKIQYDSGSEFSGSINGKNMDDVLPVIDELLYSVQIISPRLYDSVMYKLNSL